MQLTFKGFTQVGFICVNIQLKTNFNLIYKSGFKSLTPTCVKPMLGEVFIMLRLQIHNDGKEKHQSFEARLNDNDSTVYLEGYGEDKEEAIDNLKKQVDLKIKELQDIDWENFDWISWDGKVL